MVYYEDSDGNWGKHTYDDNNNMIHSVSSSGIEINNTFDELKRRIYCEMSNGYWAKYTYDDNGNELSFENSDGYWRTSTYDEHGNLISYNNMSRITRYEYIYIIK